MDGVGRGSYGAVAGGAMGAAPPVAPRGRGGSAGAWRLVPGVALLAALVLGSAAVLAQRGGQQLQEVDLASAPAASDFFASALQGLESERFAPAAAGGRGARRREVSLHTDRHGDVNLNVDIERNGKLVGRREGLKVPIGKSTHLQLALPRKGRLQQLDEDVPVAPAFPGDDEDEEGAGGFAADEGEEPLDDDDTSELGTAKQQVQDAKARVVEDAKRLHDISAAISEESEKAENAEDYKAAALEGEESAKRRAIEEVEEEKNALREAKKRADTLAITKEAEAMKAKMEAAEAKSAAKTAKARADAAEQAAQLELEKKKEELAADAEQQAWDKYEGVSAQGQMSLLRRARCSACARLRPCSGDALPPSAHAGQLVLSLTSTAALPLLRVHARIPVLLWCDVAGAAQAETEKAEAVRQAKQIAQEEKEEDAKDSKAKKKEGAVNMNIKVNVDSPVGGDYANWEERCAMQPDLPGCSPAQLEAKKEQEKRQVNMNIVVNVRSPTDTADAGAAEGGAAASGQGQQQGLSRVAMPLPP